MDARRRQVAVNVKIIDVNLNNIQDYNSSFSFGINDSYFVQDNGTAVMRFGQTAPPGVAVLDSATGQLSNPPAIPNPFVPELNTLLNIDEFTFVPGLDESLPRTTVFQAIPGVSSNPFFTAVEEFTSARRETDPETGITTFTEGEVVFGQPSFFQYPQKFQAEIFAQIRSGNAKILTDPTLIVQEGQEAQVKLTESVVTSVDTQVDPLSGVRTTTPVLEDVGLTLNVFVDRIDDNGFITVNVKPTVAAPGGQVQFESGLGSVNTLTLINKRELTSGIVRLRDDQTFILSGIISEIQQSITSKVPILGDLPVIGALFRSSTDEVDRSEVIIMLTPKIIPDSSEVQFGYQYTPDQETADFLRQKGFPVQAQP
jgi:type IV pilus assembly protein PilQ